jgi:hypothetical protein
MKTILVPTEDDDAMSSALETALILARQCDSYIEGFALRWKFAEFISADMMGGIVVKADHREITRMETQARAIFESFMQKHGVPRSTASADLLSFGWLENAPEGDAFVGSHGRVFDVIVMSRSGRNTSGLRNRAINAGLFESGRPILLAPPSPPAQIGTNVLIAWNRSTEQARATALAMPLLQKADRVTNSFLQPMRQSAPTKEMGLVCRQRRFVIVSSAPFGTVPPGRSPQWPDLLAARFAFPMRTSSID